MEVNCTKLTERILQLTLEIIYLLTGEDNIVAKKTSGDGQNFIMVPLQSLLIPQRNDEQKILEVTKKMMELLTGEVPIRCQDVTVYFSMEEWEYLEGHKELYKDIMMANLPALTSPDGSSNGNPPERCPRPLYSRNSIQEDLTIPQHDKGEEIFEIKTGIKEEEEEIYVAENQMSMMEAEMMVTITKEESTLEDSTDGSSNGNPPERCPRPLYSRNSIQEDLPIPQHDKGEEISEIKTGIKEEEEIYVAENQLSMIDAKMMVTITKEESTLEDSTEGLNIWNTSEGRLILSADYTKEDFEIAQYSPGVSIVIQDVHSDLNDMERSLDGFNSKELKDKLHTIIPNVKPSFQSADRPPDPSNPEESSSSNDLVVPKRIHTKEKPFSCHQCEKTFITKSILVKHQRVHTGEKPFSCSECGKGFASKGNRDTHMRIHTGEKPFSCSECGKGFSSKENRDKHIRIHTGEKPFSCPECGKCFSRKENRDNHMRTHTGEKPFSCPECGKVFSSKENRHTHLKIHTGEKPFSCSECGKVFSRKKNRDNHMRTHTGEKPFSCPECGKGFSSKEGCYNHMRIHTGEKPFSCSECGKHKARSRSEARQKADMTGACSGGDRQQWVNRDLMKT